MQFVTIPLPLAVLILIILAISFVWSFRLARKLDKAYEDYDVLYKSYKHINQLIENLENSNDLDKLSVQYNWKSKSK